MNMQKIVPFFQPIISMDDRNIIGYEVLGRIQTKQGYQSLGPFFHNPNVQQNKIIEVDTHIRKKALESFLRVNHRKRLLFLNIHPEWLVDNEKCNLYTMIQQYEQMGIAPQQIVLEVTEKNFSKSELKLSILLSKFRKLGCKIAVDDVGTGFSNLDRIAALGPDILKVDLNLIKQSIHSQPFRDVLYSLSILSQKIGAILLFEGIETIEQMKNAWKYGGQYYQGYLFAKPSEHPILQMNSSNFYIHEMEKIIKKHIYELKNRFLFEAQLNELFKQSFNDVRVKSDGDQYIRQFLPFIPDQCFRLYLCDENGIQVSSNVTNNSLGFWCFHKEYRNKNWSWRPYFLQNIVKMQLNKRGILSEIYIDLETNEPIVTFSYPVHKNLYLFLDIKKTMISRVNQLQAHMMS
ncbi:EAL domain-containing protein [Anaerobacillus sp. MEB173]|uniref:EAL domain-containing protein n=1 Tax=Anaerobacillus sp. MEB173 TaxID=3383345 RepID=UPI003F90D70A